MKALLAASALCCLAAREVRADDKAAGEALFENAKKLDRAGDLAGACHLFEASYHADPALGALLNLADCHERLGRTGTAWAEFREAIEIAASKSDSREAFARSRATALEPRLVRLHVDVAPTPGLVVRRGEIDITTLVAQDVVVDPASYTIEASAPGYRSWSTQVVLAREGSVETVEVPALEATPAPVAPPVEPVEHAPRPAPPAPPAPVVIHRAASPLRTWALVVGGVGLGVVGAGLGVGAYAWSEWEGTRDPSVCDHSNICSAAGEAQIEAARSHARTSTYLVGAGGATVVASLVMWWIAPRAAEHATVTPMLEANGGGVSVAGRF